MIFYYIGCLMFLFRFYGENSLLCVVLVGFNVFLFIIGFEYGDFFIFLFFVGYGIVCGFKLGNRIFLFRIGIWNK